ncbi:cysteine desulfurase family protein [Demetria terragena]|uniref:cysteine desulfurase family protein n=1 Tax=Demetria terragena TaxID=63959 RepID=UPI000362B087|nr:cysteine desulfurase family protein [Demetria terragena]
MSVEPVYLDHAATTAVRPDVVDEIATTMRHLGNPSALHASGRLARRTVEESRERIAQALDARPSEVIFTSGGTEADNLAVVGGFRARRAADPQRTTVAASTIEHHAVLDSAEYLLEHEAATVRWLEVDGTGRVRLDVASDLLAEHAAELAIISVMWANNEVGTVQPIRQLADLAQEAGVPVHTDAVQAVGQVPVSFAKSGVDLLSLTGHKLGGPVGTGALLARRDAQVQPLTFGGGQERQLRSGTLDAAGIAGFALAVERSVAERESNAHRIGALRDRLVKGALDLGIGVEVSGAYTAGETTDRLAGNAHLRVTGCEGDSLLYLLDAAGIACSTGSACTAGVPRPSHVLLAMGIPEEDARGALRLSLGHTSSQDDVDRFLAALPAAVTRARSAVDASRRSSA